MPEFFVEIVKSATDDEEETVEKRMGPHSKRTAERIESGASRNLNHESYFTRVVDDMGDEV